MKEKTDTCRAAVPMFHHPMSQLAAPTSQEDTEKPGSTGSVFMSTLPTG